MTTKLNQTINTLTMNRAQRRAMKKAKPTTLEKQYIKKAMALGYEDPFTNDQIDILAFETKGKTYRRFIAGFEEIPHNQIFQSNVRQTEVDEGYCREELIPRIKKDGLRCPAFVTRSATQAFRMEAGHHRRYSMEEIFGASKSMPCFILSKQVCEVLPDGSYGPHIAGTYLQLVSKIKSNPPRNNKEYNTTDAHQHLIELYLNDPFLGGLNPSGQFPSRQHFDLIMDDLYPDQFRYKGTRTKIHNNWSKGNPVSKNKHVSFADVTNDLAQYGYDTGIVHTRAGKQKREQFLEWEDTNNNVYLGCANTNADGSVFEKFFAMKLIKEAADGNINKKTKYNIVIHCEVINPKDTLVALNKQRKRMEQILKNWNRRFNALGYGNIKFTYIIWPKQLVSSTDKTIRVKL